MKIENQMNGPIPKAVEMEQQKIIVEGTNPAPLTKKALEDAAADARHLMAQSPVIPKLVAVDIVARQLFLLIRNGLDNEIRGGWDVEEPELVIQTLGLSAQEKAVHTPFTAVQLREAILMLVLPVVDIFCQMETANAQQRNTPSTPVSGSDDRPSQ